MIEHQAFNVPVNGGVLPLGPCPVLMGILNVTPDSFSDGGEFNIPEKALLHARAMLEQGASIIDVGGQSTRPGAEEISTGKELSRVIPIIEHLVTNGIKAPLSIDTFKTEIAQKAIEAGACIINDVTGLQREPEIADLAAQFATPIIAMHLDKNRNRDLDIMDEIKHFFAKTITIAQRAGVAKESLVLDPGFGFAKSLAENYQLLNRLNELTELGYPLLIGTSRKSMLSKLLDLPPKDCVTATAATSVIAYQQGAHIFRVHDVAANYQALQVAQATCYGAYEPKE